jgi:hypothetical protein
MTPDQRDDLPVVDQRGLYYEELQTGVRYVHRGRHRHLRAHRHQPGRRGRRGRRPPGDDAATGRLVTVPFGPALLSCPADRPDRFEKAAERSDTVILDLEDAVAPDGKAAARDAVSGALPQLPPDTVARINATDTEWFASGSEAVGGREEDDVLGPLAEQLSEAGTGRGPPRHADLLVADLVAEAVRAVQHVARPPIPQTRDVGQFVAQAGRDHYAARRHPPSVGERNLKPARPHFTTSVATPGTISPPQPVTSPRPTASRSPGGRPSRDRNPCMCAAGALRGAPESTRTDRRARDNTRAADSPAALPPITTTSYALMSRGWRPRSCRHNDRCRSWDEGVEWRGG